MTIFLSYSWSNEDYANKIDFTFSSIGVNVKRDKREVGYKMNLKEYMQSIRNCDYSFILISEEYLKSPACMYEVCEIMKERDFIDKVLPLILPNAKIYKAETQVEYIEYWKERVEELKSKIQSIGITQAIPITQKLKEYENIYANIGEFLYALAERNVPSFDNLESDGFQQIKDYIGLEDDLQNRVIDITSSDMTSEKVEIEIDKLQEEFPNRYEVYIAKGHISFVNNKFEKAIHDYEKAISLNDEFGPAYYNLGCMYQYKDEFQKAEDAYLRAIELTPTNDRIYNNLSIVQQKLGKDELAEETYQKAIGMNPFDDVKYYNYGTYLAQKKRFDEALIQYDKCLEQNSENIDCLINYGKILLNELEKPEEGIKFMERILMIDNYNSEALLTLARHYEKNEEIDLSKKFYESYLALNREDIFEHESYLLFLHKNFNEDKDTMGRLLSYINLLKDRKNE
jgi:tetratricopeptide (TPR) repeat protein